MVTSSKPKKPILPVMVDIETLSLDRRAAIIDVAIAPIMDGMSGTRWLVTPSSYNNHPSFIRDPETVAFHSNNNSRIMEDAEMVGHSWQRVAQELYDAIYGYTAQYEIHMWSQGKDFDIPVLEHFFKQAGLKTPWKYSNTHCLRDLAQQYLEVKRSWYGNHTAMKDVQAQVKHLHDLCAYSDRVYKFVYGGE